MGVKLIWSAMTIAYKDKPEEVLPQVLPQNLATLEQEIIGPVYRLTRERTPQGGRLRAQKQVDQQLAMMYLQQGMQPPEPQEQFTRVSPSCCSRATTRRCRSSSPRTSPIPDDADLLIVMAIAPLNERQVYEINRALRNGLPVVMAVQAHEYGYSPGQRGGWTITGQAVDHRAREPCWRASA